MKKFRFLLALAAIFSSLVWLACDRDDSQPTSKADLGQKVTTSFTGQVIDENGQPVADAVIRVGGNSLKTDANGAFILRDQDVWSKRAIVQVFKAGYWTTSRTLFANDKSSSSLIFRLLQKKTIGSVTGSTGGKLTMPGGATLDFPAGSVMKNGTVYNGKVSVAATWLNPSSATLPVEMPGALRGISTDGSEQVLGTAGMIGVELTDATGNELQVMTGQTVEISVPIPADLQATAPQTIPLWHFDETEGLWVEDGSAEKSGDRYVGRVSHFSWWNYDAKFPTVNLKLCLVDNEGTALANTMVILDFNGWKTYGWTDSSGCVSGLIPKDEVLVMELASSYNWWLNCTSVYFTQNIGPFSVDTDLGTIVVTPTPNPNIVTNEITGSLVDCANATLTNGYVKIETGNQVFLAFPDAAGSFSFTHTYCSNNPPASYTITAFDFTNAKQSDPQTVAAAPTINLGTIAACTTLAEYINFSLDGTAYMVIDPTGGFDGTYGSISGPFSPNGQSQFSLFWNGKTVGEHDVQYINIYGSGIPVLDSLGSPLVKVQIDQVGNVGDPTIGSFNGTVKDATNQTHTLTGTYKVNRDF